MPGPSCAIDTPKESVPPTWLRLSLVIGIPPLGLGHGNFGVHKKPAENHSPTNDRRNWPGELLCACSVRRRPAPPVNELCSPTSESRRTHSAASVGASEGGGVVLAGEGGAEADEGAADEGAVAEGAADVPLGSAGKGAFALLEPSGGGSGGGLPVWAIAAKGATQPARAPNVRKKRKKRE